MAPASLRLHAMPGRSIVWFMPFRRANGVLEIAEKYRESSVEAIVIDDNTHHRLPRGTKIVASRKRGHGINFTCGAVELCSIGVEGMLIIDLEFSPEAVAA